jgi:hypothetical protein
MASNLKFKTESERLSAARGLAREGLKKYSPEFVKKWGEQNILLDLEHEALLSLPASPETPA